MRTLLLRWQAAADIQFAEVALTRNDPDSAVDISSVLPEWSDSIIYPALAIITLGPSSLGLQPTATVLLDERPLTIFGTTRLAVKDLKTVSFLCSSMQADSITIRFYTGVTDEGYFSAHGAVGLSLEIMNTVIYTAFIYQKAGVWCWKNNGTVPFNNDLPVTTPIKLRDTNPMRANNLKFFGGIYTGELPSLITGPRSGEYALNDRGAKFPACWGTSADKCNIPFTTGRSFSIVDDYLPDDGASYGIFNVLAQPGNKTILQPPYGAPATDAALTAYGVSYGGYGRGFMPTLIPKGEIWISIHPRDVAGADPTIYQMPLMFNIN